MRFGEVVNVNVVANARAIDSRIVIAKDFQGRSFALDCLQDERNQVRFRIMILANLASVVGPSRIEVSEGHVAQAVRATISLERILQRELGCAVGIYRLAGSVLGNRRFVRSAIDCRGRRKMNLRTRESITALRSASAAVTLL